MFFRLSFLMLLLTVQYGSCKANCDIAFRRSFGQLKLNSSIGVAKECFNNFSKAINLTVWQKLVNVFLPGNYISSQKIPLRWFSWQMKTPVLVASVSLKLDGYSLSKNQSKAQETDIEIFSSTSMNNDVHNCAVSNRDQFVTSLNHFTRCGVTKVRTGVAGNYTVSCITQTRHLLMVQFNHIEKQQQISDVTIRTASLGISASQIVSEGSNFTVSCLVKCGTSELKKSVLLCSPNSECTQQHKMEIVRATRLDAGDYVCKLNSTLHPSSIRVLSSSSSKSVVSENSSFSVSCRLYCNAENLCSSDLPHHSNVQLCYPNNICINATKSEINRAKAEHSGNFRCKVGRVEHRRELKVLYPPSRIDVSIANNVTCQRLSDLTVILTLSASNPLAEHRFCIAVLDGSGNFSLTRQRIGTSGRISEWIFIDNRAQKLSSGTIECIVEQSTLTEGVGFRRVHRASARWSCGQSNVLDFIIIADVILLTVFFIILLYALIAVYRFVKVESPDRISEPMSSLEIANPIPSMISETQQQTDPVALMESSNKTPNCVHMMEECIYPTLGNASADDFSDENDQQPDDISVITYILYQNYNDETWRSEKENVVSD